jgi:gliding motility-associated-like protein
VGGNTGEVACVADCNGDFGGTAFLDNCATCVGGNTGEVACVADCNGDFGGTAFLDNCATCVGGNTGEVACVADCNGDFGGTAFIDNCATCVGGNTGEVACIQDCNGDFGGTAFIDNCATCVGGNTGEVACVQDCNGDFGGTAFLDNCATCVGGNTGEVACVQDCNGDFGGTAFIDNCATCVGGNTGEVACVADCNGDFGGTAFLDNCATCVGGNTGEVACVQDCNGDFGGTAFIDNCATCVGGNTGEVACTADCNGDFGGTALPGTTCDDNNANTVGDTWNTSCACIGTPINFDCEGVSGGSASPGTACDDQNEGTINDIWTADCQCSGTIVSCSSDAGADQSTCATALNLNASGIGSWSGPGFVTISEIDSPQSLITCTVPGTYTLVWTVSISGCTATDDVEVTFHGTPDASFTYASTTICSDGSIISPSTSTTGGTFMAPTGLAINASSGAIDPSNSEQGSYEVTYTLDGTCPISSMQVITVNDALDPSWAAPQSVCANATIISLDELITGDGGGIWSGQGVNAAMFDPAVVEGSSLVTYTVGSGSCEQSSSATIVVTPAPQANGGADAFTCDPEYQLSANAFGGTGIWSTDGMAQFLPNASDPNAIVTGAGPGTYVLFWTVSNDVCSSTDTIRITFLDPATDLTIDAGQDQILEVETNTFLEATTTPGANVTWTLLNGSGSIATPNAAQTDVHGLGIGPNTFIATVSLGQCIGTSDTIVVRVKDLFIPQGFSPNGDGDNDLFEVTGMAAYPGSELMIYNRWGQEVFSDPAYANGWGGRSKNGSDLPNDTYFYLLNLSDGTAYNGFVVIKR